MCYEHMETNPNNAKCAVRFLYLLFMVKKYDPITTTKVSKFLQVSVAWQACLNINSLLQNCWISFAPVFSYIYC